jgi:hypothetical protein
MKPSESPFSENSGNIFDNLGGAAKIPPAWILDVFLDGRLS